MSLNIQQTDTFEYTFKVLIEFIQSNWGEKVVDEFVGETEKVIRLIANFPYMYKSSVFDETVRVATINKLSSLFYEVTESHLILLYIVDSRQEPLWL